MTKKKSYEVRTTTRIKTEDLAGILVTAIEGGINYWLTSLRVDEKIEGALGRLPSKVVVTIDDDENSEKTIGVGTIVLGIERILSGGVGVRADLVGQVAGFLGEINAGTAFPGGTIDAEGADVIVQAGLFDEIVYS